MTRCSKELNQRSRKRRIWRTPQARTTTPPPVKRQNKVALLAVVGVAALLGDRDLCRHSRPHRGRGRAGHRTPTRLPFRPSTSCIRRPCRPTRRWCCRDRPGLQRHADLRPHQRLSEALVFRYRRPCAQGQLLAEIETPELDRAAAPGARRPRDGRGEYQAGRDHRRSAPRTC